MQVYICKSNYIWRPFDFVLHALWALRACDQREDDITCANTITKANTITWANTITRTSTITRANTITRTNTGLWSVLNLPSFFSQHHSLHSSVIVLNAIVGIARNAFSGECLWMQSRGDGSRICPEMSKCACTSFSYVVHKCTEDFLMKMIYQNDYEGWETEFSLAPRIDF